MLTHACVYMYIIMYVHLDLQLRLCTKHHGVGVNTYLFGKYLNSPFATGSVFCASEYRTGATAVTAVTIYVRSFV